MKILLGFLCSDVKWILISWTVEKLRHVFNLTNVTVVFLFDTNQSAEFSIFVWKRVQWQWFDASNDADVKCSLLWGWTILETIVFQKKTSEIRTGSMLDLFGKEHLTSTDISPTAHRSTKFSPRNIATELSFTQRSKLCRLVGVKEENDTDILETDHSDILEWVRIYQRSCCNRPIKKTSIDQMPFIEIRRTSQSNFIEKKSFSSSVHYQRDFGQFQWLKETFNHFTVTDWLTIFSRFVPFVRYESHFGKLIWLEHCLWWVVFTVVKRKILDCKLERSNKTRLWETKWPLVWMSDVEPLLPHPSKHQTQNQ